LVIEEFSSRGESSERGAGSWCGGEVGDPKAAFQVDEAMLQICNSSGQPADLRHAGLPVACSLVAVDRHQARQLGFP